MGKCKKWSAQKFRHVYFGHYLEFSVARFLRTSSMPLHNIPKFQLPRPSGSVRNRIHKNRKNSAMVFSAAILNFREPDFSAIVGMYLYNLSKFQLPTPTGNARNRKHKKSEIFISAAILNFRSPDFCEPVPVDMPLHNISKFQLPTSSGSAQIETTKILILWILYRYADCLRQFKLALWSPDWGW